MLASWSSCKNTCIGSDPTQDTVKVDMSTLQGLVDKENMQPSQFVKESPDQLDAALQKNLSDARRRDAEEQAMRRKEEEAATHAAHAQAAQLCREDMERDAKKLNEIKERCQQMERESDEKRVKEIKARQEAEQKAQQEAEAAAAEQLRAQQAQAQQAQQAADAEGKQETVLRLQLAAAQRTVDAWCKKNGFSDMNTPKKTMRGATKFPLHTAVKHQDSETLKLLLKCGADQNVRDSRKQTPKELAAAINKNGSHHNILAILR